MSSCGAEPRHSSCLWDLLQTLVPYAPLDWRPTRHTTSFSHPHIPRHGRHVASLCQPVQGPQDAGRSPRPEQADSRSAACPYQATAARAIRETSCARCQVGLPSCRRRQPKAQSRTQSAPQSHQHFPPSALPLTAVLREDAALQAHMAELRRRSLRCGRVSRRRERPLPGVYFGCRPPSARTSSSGWRVYGRHSPMVRVAS